MTQRTIHSTIEPASTHSYRQHLANEPLLAALAYAVAGWPILPLHTPTPAGGCSCRQTDCSSAGKHPRTRHGLTQATTDPQRIAAWWKRWPNANVGIATGDLVVIDIDGPDGARALDELQTEHGPLPVTRAVRTGRGLHLYFAVHGHAIANSAGRLGPGIDVRGRGGYIVAPPSRHATGDAYTWANATLPAPLPRWLAERLIAPEVVKPRRALPSTVIDGQGTGANYVASALEGEVTNVLNARVKTRNDTLNRAAFRIGQLCGAGIGDRDDIADALLDAALRAGLPEREASATIASGLGAGERHPRPIPPRRSRRG
jgi:hypothetical protein